MIALQLHSMTWRLLGGVVGAVLLAGCTPPNLTARSGELNSLQAIVRVASDRFLAWSPDGSQLAVEHHGLKIYRLADGALHDTPIKHFDCVAWGDPGLASAVSEDTHFSLRLLDAQGQLRELASGEGDVVDLAWASGQTLLALVLRHETYSFGINQRSYLIAWKPDSPLVEELLADVTLKPSTPRLSKTFPLGPTLMVSPVGDEIIYRRLHDPPAFRAGYRVMVRHLATGRERKLGDQPLSVGGLAMMADGETALFADERQLLQLELWGEAREQVADEMVQHVAVAGEYSYIDGALFRRQQRLWELPADFPGIFSPDGRHLAIIASAWLYLLDLPEAAARLAVTPQLLKLRRLRALGLISADDYRRFRKEW